VRFTSVGHGGRYQPRNIGAVWIETASGEFVKTIYQRILQLRAETELALGDRFDRLAFNDFLLDQGLLTPDQLAIAVREELVPARRPDTGEDG